MVFYFILFYFTSNYIVLPRFTIWFHSELKFRECLVLYYLIFTKYFILFYFTVLDLFLGLVLFRHFFIFILFFFCVLSGSEFNFRVWIVFIFILFFRYVFYWFRCTRSFRVWNLFGPTLFYLASGLAKG